MARGRLRVGGYLDGLAVVDTGGGRRQRPQGLLSLHAEALPAPRWLRGFLELRARAGGPFEGGHPGVYTLVHAFQNRSPALEVREAFVEALGRRAEARAGLQTFAWGKLDGIPPTDVLNPRDYHDPFVEDFEERKIGVPALRGSLHPGDLPRLGLHGLRADLVYLPLAAPSRLPLLEERWFPGSFAPGSRIVVPREVIAARTGILLGEDLAVPLDLRTVSRRPPRRLDAGGIALRLAGTWRDVDWDVYHYTGPETGPNVELRSRVAAVGPFDLSAPRLRSTVELRQAHDLIHMTGADAAVALGGATVRAEAAWFRDRPYLRLARDLLSRRALAALPFERLLCRLRARGRTRVPLGDLFVDLDAVEWGLGADYLVRGFQPIVQVNQIVILESAPRLLVADPETRLSGTLRRRWMQERLELEVRGAYAIERESWIVFPRASYSLWDDLRVRIGYLAIGGPRASLLGQFRDNDEVVFQARYSF